jgi:hypothetical protein
LGRRAALPLPRLQWRVWWLVGGNGSGAALATVVRPAPHTVEWPPTVCDCLCVCDAWVAARGAGRDVQSGPGMPRGMLVGLGCHPPRLPHAVLCAPCHRGGPRTRRSCRRLSVIACVRGWLRGARGATSKAGPGREGAMLGRLGMPPLAPSSRGARRPSPPWWARPRTRRSGRRLSVIACMYAVRGWVVRGAGRDVQGGAGAGRGRRYAG